MQKFLVLYLCPISVVEEWVKTDPETMKAEEKKMQDAWRIWAQEYKDLVKETAGAGKTKRVSKEGITDIKNDVMLYSIVEAESPEIVAEAFSTHPHLSIPESSIEIMPANMLSGMKDF